MTTKTTESDARNADGVYNWGMNPEHVKKKWQNLIHKRCITCGEPLQEVKDVVVFYECPNVNRTCKIITRRKMFEILTDETHVLRTYLTEHERQALEEAVANLLS